jgi:hypothetical protein
MLVGDLRRVPGCGPPSILFCILPVILPDIPCHFSRVSLRRPSHKHTKKHLKTITIIESTIENAGIQQEQESAQMTLGLPRLMGVAPCQAHPALGYLARHRDHEGGVQARVVGV